MIKWFALASVFLTNDAIAYVSSRHSSNPEHVLGIIFGGVLISLIFYAFIFFMQNLSVKAIHGTKYVKKEIKSQHEKHKLYQEKYRKYLRDCDKQGKTPLTYKQWKFAYTDKPVKKTKTKPNQSQKRQTAKIKQSVKRTHYYDIDDDD